MDTDSTAAPLVLRARYTYLGGRRVVENHAVVVANGVIRAIERADRVSAKRIELGDALLVPGFVNAHTHLELGYAAGCLTGEMGFVDWLRGLMARIREASADDVSRVVRCGLRESVSHGVTTLGDITRQPAATRRIIASATGVPTVVSFGEVIATGTLRDGAAGRIAEAADDSLVTPRLGIGISPHAPYTVERAAMTASAEVARRRALPVCIHAAETRDELDYCRSGGGPLREFLGELQVFDDRVPPIGASPIAYLDECGVLGPRTLLVHCNYVDGDDIARIRTRGARVAYCPRTHAAFGHSRYPLDRLLSAGVGVCLGTDSLASNPDLSILEELRFAARRYRDIAPHDLIEMATLNGAAALGLGDITGRLQPGLRADLVAVPVNARSVRHACDALIDGDAPVLLTCLRGRVITRPSPPLPTGDFMR